MRTFLHPFSFPIRRRIITSWVRLGLYHGTVHEGFDALSPNINKEVSETTVKQWCDKLGLRYERRQPSWARGSRDLFFNAWREDFG